MDFKWFSLGEIPYHKMWDTDQHWLPHIIKGKRIKGKFYFNEDTETTKSFEINELT